MKQYRITFILKDHTPACVIWANTEPEARAKFAERYPGRTIETIEEILT